MRPRVALFALAFPVILVLLPQAAYAAIPFFGPVVPDSLKDCPGAFAGLITVVNGIISLLITLAITIVAPLMIAYAGFLFVVNPFNPGAKSRAKTMLLNTVIGIVVSLAAYLIVAGIMAVLYKPQDPASAWDKLVYGTGSVCLPVNTAFLHPSGGQTDVSGAGTNVQTGVVGGGLNPSPNAIGVCTPQGLQNLTDPPIDPNIASTLSCITKYEDSSCDPAAPSSTDKGSDGNTVSWGLFQINISANDLNYPACQKLNGGAALNCKSAFSGGAYTSTNHSTAVQNASLYDLCVKAASDPSCNAQAGQTIYQKQGIGAWGTAARQSCSSS